MKEPTGLNDYEGVSAFLVATLKGVCVRVRIALARMAAFPEIDPVFWRATRKLKELFQCFEDSARGHLWLGIEGLQDIFVVAAEARGMADRTRPRDITECAEEWSRHDVPGSSVNRRDGGEMNRSASRRTNDENPSQTTRDVRVSQR